MKRSSLTSIALVLFLVPLVNMLGVDVSRAVECYCRNCAPRPDGLVKPAANGRHYAPDMVVDVRHLAIDVTPDFKRRRISATATLTFAPISRPVDSITLDAHNLDVLKVSGSIPIAEHHLVPNGIQIVFKQPIPTGQEASVTVAYEAEPKEGLYFRTPEMGYKPEDTHLWTQGEPHMARHWFPSFDYPNQRFTSEVTCRVPPEMAVVSNGRLVSEQIDKATGKKVVHWSQEKPHANYLIALVAGKLSMLEDRAGDTKLRFITPPSQAEYAKSSFQDTADMVRFFEKETGVTFPWAKYDQVVVDDFMWGGMENTSITILTDRTLFSSESENLHSSQYLVAHELAHQWFGDYVTCKDWSHLWLNEGFAVFYSNLYEEHKHGRDAMLYALYNDFRGLVSNKEERRPIVYTAYNDAIDQFDGRAYAKGGWVLHMLRTQLGADLYRRGIAEYLKRNGLRSVSTQNLQDVLEDVSGASLQQFFDQWVYHGGVPQLKVSQSWDAKTQLAQITVKQTQTTDDKVLLFRLPVKLRFRTAKGVVERQVEISGKQHDFYVPLPAQAESVRFDADFGTLADVSFDLPRPMLYAQLEDRDDIIGRLLAIGSLKSNDDAETITRLQKSLREDPFYGVRIEASRALREIKTDAARRALTDSLTQPDARVRLRVVEDLGAFYHPEVQQQILMILDKEKNPDIRAAALRSLSKYAGPETHQRLRAALDSRSYRNGLASAAIDTIRQLEDPTLVGPLKTTLQKREAEFPTATFGTALDTLAYIARHQEDRGAVREFLAGYTLHPKREMRVASLRALGTLQDPKAIPLVASFDVGRDGDPVKGAASEALAKLREVNKVPVELGELRGVVSDLKKSTDELRKELDEQKKKLEAISERDKPKK